MGALDRDGFLNRKVVKLVELSGEDKVFIRALPAILIIAAAESDEKAKEVFGSANLLLNSLCNDKGELLFNPGAPGESEAVLTIDHQALKTIMDAIVELNALKAAPEDEESAAVKN